MVEPLCDNELMPFGKHKGTSMEFVPASYLLWFSEQTWAEEWPEVLAYVKKNQKLLEQELREKRNAKGS